MIDSTYKYSDLTRKIIGLAMEVHRNLGNGFQEAIYQRALSAEFENNNLEFHREKEMAILYKGKILVQDELIFL